MAIDPCIDLIAYHYLTFHILNFRFSVEVADFNFGESSSVDLEYKTFHQRILDSVRELIHRPQPTDTIEPTDSSLKYGTMT